MISAAVAAWRSTSVSLCTCIRSRSTAVYHHDQDHLNDHRKSNPTDPPRRLRTETDQRRPVKVLQQHHKRRLPMERTRPQYIVSTCRFSSSTTNHPEVPSASSLPKWHAAVAQVPASKMLPLGFGADSSEGNVAAFFGDRRINVAVALSLQRLMRSKSSSDDMVGVPWLSKVQSEAISNHMFASHLEQILPVQSQSVVGMAEFQPHNAGTMVEAAVEEVASSSPGGSAGQEAVEELAQWLVAMALKRGPTNHKGDVIEAGGTVVSKMLEGYADHEPRFVATAQLFDERCEAEGRSKISAEQAASAQLLNLLLGGSERSFANTTMRVQFDNEESDPGNEAYDFVELHINAAMNLRDGEDEKGWWMRGATKRNDAFHRAMMAPHVFPDKISVAKCWRRRDCISGQNFVLVVVIGKRQGQESCIARSFLACGKSMSSARRASGMEASRFIATEILGLSLGEGNNDHSM